MAQSLHKELESINLDEIPSSALNVSSRMTLSWFLNPEQSMRSTSGTARDYRGLAELMDFDFNDIRNFQRSDDPTSKILDTWEKKPNSSIGELIKFLEKMERFDVIDDIKDQFNIDALAYMKRNRLSRETPIQVPEVTSCRPTIDSQVDNPNALTLDDVKSGKCMFYDAYVCFAEEDTWFVLALAEYLEKPEIGLKLYIKGRDLLLGALEINSYAQLIEERCNRMLIILSPEFLRSGECEFQTSIAAGLAIEQRQRKLIPIVIKPCEIPLILRYVSKIDFTKPGVRSWLWVKLIESIRGSQSTKGSSIFVSLHSGAPQFDFLCSQPQLSLPGSSDPIVVFPDTVQHNLQQSSSRVPALSKPISTANDTVKSVPAPASSGNSSKQTSTRNKWFSNIRERMTFSPTTAQTSSSIATSGYQSQSE